MSGNTDGKKLSYLSNPKIWRHFDPDLFDFLQDEIQQNARVINESTLGGLLPGTRFFFQFLQDAAELRAEYFKELFHNLPRNGGLLFFDPDNGLEVSSSRKGTKGSSKYLYWDEVVTAYESGHSVLIYQHFQRVKRKQFIRKISEKATAETGATIFAYVTSHVVFFLLARPEHLDHFRDANEKLAQQWHSQIVVISNEDVVIQPTCPFCNLNPTSIIASNDHAQAVYDNYPVTPGHTLIIPKRHITSFFEATREEQAAMLDLLAEMRLLLLNPSQPPFAKGRSQIPPNPPFLKGGVEAVPDGFNIGINDGAAAGQTVMHLHIHLIPRYVGDTTDPRGGVRWIKPEKAPYWKQL
ncbi:MAG: HIT family protein [Desulfuromonadales bacterium]|nr:HIT family protein [Desulfuromonadales bacterium]